MMQVRSTLLIASSLILALAACAKQQPPREAPLTTVAAATASQTTIYPSEQLAGIVAPYQNVGIQSTLAEPADEVDVQEGDVVRRGEIIARFDTADLEANLAADLANAQSAQANSTKTVYQGGLSIAQGVDTLKTAQATLRQAQANLQRDQTDLARYRALAAQGYISQQQLQQVETTVRDDEASVRSAQAAVSSAASNVSANGNLNQSGIQAATVAQSRAGVQMALAQAQQQRVQIAKATVVSPIDGVVVNRNINPGEYPGTRQIFTLQQVDPIFAVLHGSGAEVAHVATGASATIQSTDLRQNFIGRVIGVLNQVQPGSTDFQIKVELRNPRGRLRPGMAVGGIVKLPAVRGVGVPQTAFTDDSHTGLLTIGPDSTVHAQSVSELGTDGKTAIVRGLQAGTRVVANGQSGIVDGQKVAVR